MSFPTVAALFFSAPIPQVQEHPNTDGVVEKFLNINGVLRPVISAASVSLEQEAEVDAVLGAVTIAAEVDNEVPTEGPTEAHRYWRFMFLGDNGDPNNIILLRYIGMSVGGGTSEALNDSMTASASSTFFGAPGDEVLFNAQNVLHPINPEGWATQTGSVWPQWWKVDVGVGNELFPTSVWITPQTVARSPSGFTLAWSDDNVSWTDVETFSSTTGWTGGSIRQFVLS